MSSGFRVQGLVLIGAVAALGFAFYWQYVGGLHPCELCVWQRWGYVAVIIFSVIPALERGSESSLCGSPLKAGMTGMVSLALAVEVGIAVYHAGIEMHWWEGFQNCSSALGAGMTLEEIKAKLAGTPLVRCDEAVWKFAGISMAGWNAVYAFGLFIISVVALSSSRSGAGIQGRSVEALDPRAAHEDDKKRGI